MDEEAAESLEEESVFIANAVRRSVRSHDVIHESVTVGAMMLYMSVLQ